MIKLPFKIPAFAGMTVVVIALSACASIIEGSTQTISVATQPNFSATCGVTGENINTSFTAPGTVSVPKSAHPITITCTPHNGSAAGTAKVLSDVGAWGYGGAVATLGVGAVVDSATGAANKYPDNVIVVLGQTTKVGETPYNRNADYNQ